MRTSRVSRRRGAVIVAAMLALSLSSCAGETPLIGSHGSGHNVTWKQARKQVTDARQDTIDLLPDGDWTGNRPAGGECTHADEDGVFFQAHAKSGPQKDPLGEARKLAKAWRAEGLEATVRSDSGTASGKPYVIHQVVSFDYPELKSIGVAFTNTQTVITIDGHCGYGITAYQLWGIDD